MLEPRHLRPTQDGLAGAMGGEVPPEIRAHEFRLWFGTDPTKVESVGVPAGADGGVLVVKTIRMAGARSMQEGEAVIGNVEEDAAEGCRELRAPQTVGRIREFVLAAAVVKQGEQTDHHHIRAGAGCEVEAVVFDAPPVRLAVDGTALQRELRKDVRPETRKINGWAHEEGRVLEGSRGWV